MAASQPVRKPSVLWVDVNQPVSFEVPGMVVAVPGVLTRLSEEGAWVRSEVEVEVGKPISVDWKCRVDKPFRLPGRIVTMKQEPDSTIRLYGLRFVDLPRHDLEELIREILDIDRRAKARPERESSVSKQVAAQLGTKRAAFRASVEFDAKYGRPGQSMRSGKASNVSTGGLALETIETFEVGVVLDFLLDLPTDVLKKAKLAPSGDKTIHGVPVRPFERLKVKGKVVKATRPKQSSPWSYGIAFVDPDQLVVDELRRYIHLSQLDTLTNRIKDL
jgi:hypothetical protein